MDWESFYNNFRKPDFISGYEIQNRLGGGAFGDVYKARKQSIGKPYAIKFLKIEDSGQRDAVERELDQVRHFAAIDHPNLVTIEDMGSVMDVPYLIMGYAGEDTLARRLKGGKMARDEALLYFTQACRGVLALHDRRLVHFDLKPSNIFLKGDVARVGDYGLSKLLTDGRMTLSFGRGTPQYMAPEILRSRADHRADIYSLGVILYETLTGELPFRPEAEGGLVLREKDDPPGFPADFPAVLRPAVEHCLRLSPDDRFSEVGELLEAIGQTGRQGDSVRIDWESRPPVELLPRTAPPAPGPGDGDPGESTDKKSSDKGSDDLRQTAADLARGAVEVARGVWEGLRSGREEQEVAATEGTTATAQAPETPVAPSAPARDADGPAIEDAATAGDNDAQTPSSARSQARKAAESVSRSLREAGRALKDGKGSAHIRARTLVRGLRGRKKRQRKSHSLPPALGTQTAAGGGTVPVPPRVQGGWVGTVLSSAVVAMEVLVAMLGNLVRGVVRFFQALTEKLLRSSGGLFVRTVRLIAFLVLMVALGFTVMMVGMVFLNAVGVEG